MGYNHLPTGVNLRHCDSIYMISSFLVPGGGSPLSKQPSNLKTCDTIRTSHRNTTVLDVVGNSRPARVASHHSMAAVSWLSGLVGECSQHVCHVPVDQQTCSSQNEQGAKNLLFNATSKKVQGYLPSKRGLAPKYVEARSHVEQ